MSAINISGHIQHIPGIWGVDSPVKRAIVEIIDIDPGKTDDIIWTGTTDDNGNFSGISREWQGSITFSVWVQDSWWPPAGHWENRNIPDIGDLLLLKLRVTQAGRTHEVFPFFNPPVLPVIVPWGPPTILTKNSRALIIVNNLAANTPDDLKFLYEFLEASGENVARSILGPYYQSVTSLNGSAATFDGFCHSIQSASQLPGVRAIDVIINAHGSAGQAGSNIEPYIVFADGNIHTSKIIETLRSLNLQNKLRMVYSTACYGSLHASAFRSGGFNSAIGSKKVNANSITEYPLFLSKWVAGYSLNAALSAAQTAELREPADAIARIRLGDRVNSYKTIAGDHGVTIESAG